MSSGTPSSCWGSSSLAIVMADVCSSMPIAARTTSEPCPVLPDRMKGPASAGVTIERPNGWPAYGPVRKTLPPETVSGEEPGPTVTDDVPICELAGQAPALACGSRHLATPLRTPSSPGGVVTLTRPSVCSPS